MPSSRPGWRPSSRSSTCCPTRALARHHLLPAVRADLLGKLARPDEARVEFERAAGMTDNERKRDLPLSRAAECVS